MPQRLLGEGPTPVANRDPRPSLDVQTEPLEMMGGSGLVSVPLSARRVTSNTSIPSEISHNNRDVDLAAPSSSKKFTSDFLEISHGVL